MEQSVFYVIAKEWLKFFLFWGINKTCNYTVIKSDSYPINPKLELNSEVSILKYFIHLRGFVILLCQIALVCPHLFSFYFCRWANTSFFIVTNNQCTCFFNILSLLFRNQQFKPILLENRDGYITIDLVILFSNE